MKLHTKTFFIRSSTAIGVIFVCGIIGILVVRRIDVYRHDHAVAQILDEQEGSKIIGHGAYTPDETYARFIDAFDRGDIESAKGYCTAQIATQVSQLQNNTFPDLRETEPTQYFSNDRASIAYVDYQLQSTDDEGGGRDGIRKYILFTRLVDHTWRIDFF